MSEREKEGGREAASKQCVLRQKSFEREANRKGDRGMEGGKTLRQQRQNTMEKKGVAAHMPKINSRRHKSGLKSMKKLT